MQRRARLPSQIGKGKTIYQQELNKIHDSYQIMRQYAEEQMDTSKLIRLNNLQIVLEILDNELDSRN